jgi:pyruvate carboxylase
MHRAAWPTRTALLVITVGVIGAEAGEIVHLSHRPCNIQQEICQVQSQAQIHAYDATLFATVSLAVSG